MRAGWSLTLLLQVNSLVTDRLMLQQSLDQARAELAEERRRTEEAEERAQRLEREASEAKEKCEEFERRLREEGMSSSGVGSIHSDQDSGKHSDTSLVISRFVTVIQTNPHPTSLQRGLLGRDRQGQQVLPQEGAREPASGAPGEGGDSDLSLGGGAGGGGAGCLRGA